MLKVPDKLKLNKGYASSIRNKYVTFNYYYERGLGYSNKVKQPAIILTALKIFQVPNKWLILLAPLLVLLLIFIGWLDKNHLKIWQSESDWGSREINPFNQEMLKRIKGIEKKLNKKIKK